MIQQIWKWVIAASALVVLAPASAALAGDQVPFEGSLTIIPQDSTGTMTAITGVVSHLGACTGCSMLSNPQTLTGMFTLTAANGDQIFGQSMNGVFTSTGSFTENIVITGGTGRFANATGTAKGQGQVVFSSTGVPIALETFQGTISSPGSSD
jgi:hypothetical protein